MSTEISKNNQFVTVPNKLVEEEEINPKSLVIYCAIKRYMNKETMSCFPTLETIAEKSGCSIPTVKNAISELVKTGYLTVTYRTGQSNLYTFSKHKNFEPFSYDFLDDTNIKLREKAYLIAQQKNMFIKEESGLGVSSYPLKTISEKTHMSESTILRCENNLIKAGYLTKIQSNNVDRESGTHEQLRLYLLELYNAVAINMKQTQQNTEDIQELQKENEEKTKRIEELEKTVDILKREVFKKQESPEISLF